MKDEKVSILILEYELILGLELLSLLSDLAQDFILVDLAITNLQRIPNFIILRKIWLEVHVEKCKLRLLKAVLFSVFIFSQPRK